MGWPRPWRPHKKGHVITTRSGLEVDVDESLANIQKVVEAGLALGDLAHREMTSMAKTLGVAVVLEAALLEIKRLTEDTKKKEG